MTSMIAKRKPGTEAKVRAEGERRIEAIAKPYRPGERETWPVQIAEAEAVTADPATPTPLLDALRAPRGLTVAQMAARVLTKRDQFRSEAGAILAAQESLIATDPIPHDYADDAHWPAGSGES